MNDEASMVNLFGKHTQIGIMDKTDAGEDARGGPNRVRAAKARQILYLDLSDLMVYAGHNGTLSGIQRVVSSILTYAQEWWEGQSAYDIVPVVPEYDRRRVLAVDLGRVVSMIKLIEEHEGARDKIDAAIEAVFASRFEVYPRRGDLFVIAGAFWIYAHYDLIKYLRHTGVVFGLFVHDLIQIKNPEYVHKEATLAFRRSLIDALSIANFVLTNSHFVADEVKQFLAERLDFDLPVAAVPLATELRLKAKGADARLPNDVTDILARDYVLCVGTIEVRKNHLLLTKIWERLADELGEALPDLVFVGKWGWDIAPLKKHLEETDFLDGRMRVLTNASDAALVELYRHCLMTSYVSFAEGFGLPVGESLAYGKPCVASRATSLPEVGGDFAKYIDPNDPEEGVKLFKALLTDRGEIERWSAHIKANYAPKTWRKFTYEFLDICCVMAKEGGVSRLANNCLLPAGAVYYLGNGALRRLDGERGSLSTFRMARDEGWHPIEDWGCWASQAEASLTFRTNLSAGAGVVVSLLLQAPPGGRSPQVTVRINNGQSRRFRLYRLAAWCVMAGAVADDGLVHVQLQCRGEFGRPDTRDLYVGLHALEIQSDSRDARTAMLRRSFVSRGRAAMRHAASRITPRIFLASPKRTDDSFREAIADRFAALENRLSREAAQLRLPFVRSGGEANVPLSLALPAPGVLTTPAGLYMTSTNCLGRDFYAAEYADFCNSIGKPVELHRRIWEYAFVAQHLEQRGVLVPGSRGLAIGADDDPLPRLFGARGCQIALSSEDGLVDRRFDYLWLISAKVNGSQTSAQRSVLDLIERQLKRGGVAVIAGDFDISAYERTSSAETPRAYTRADIEQLVQFLAERGHKVAPLSFELGLTTLDTLVDMPPFASGVHLKIVQNGSVITCFGLVVVSATVSRG